MGRRSPFTKTWTRDAVLTVLSVPISHARVADFQRRHEGRKLGMYGWGVPGAAWLTT
jgi:hypothetical protein